MWLALVGSLVVTSCSSTPDVPYATAIETQAPYTLGPGDKLRITVFGEETLTGEYRVTGDGQVSFPLIGNVPADGRTVEDLQQDLQARLANGYLSDPRVSTEVLDYRPYYILGEVNRPGQYTYSVGLTIEQAVAAAGGFTYRANDERIYLKRAMDTQERLVDLDRMPSFAVRPGDTIRVGERFF
ncbi:polysaccharide biosynthesis/export family protein [Aurantiacibacter poecillastricola]|uniref:polysaccharide biosynthesis/export family protein n=1 Tax=Aurantiacibacter poecillastricola TaxID=3064385 RepID=UPI00273F0A07|nr:polysaccharide biosynthesis/export family protein [Aurantiacibacter sp. 219JJ12-13]MDP5263219.1 polysaccharide biosynthesis/export family protein [Aurantiacibacter sp. 219JJ12-13]